jgi:hypothetical protein
VSVRSLQQRTHRAYSGTFNEGAVVGNGALDDGSGQALRRPSYESVKHILCSSKLDGVASARTRLPHDRDHCGKGLVAVVGKLGKKFALLHVARWPPLRVSGLSGFPRGFQIPIALRLVFLAGHRSLSKALRYYMLSIQSSGR